MHMAKLASLFLTVTLSLISGTALTVETNIQSNNGQANSSADAGQVAPDARESVALNNIGNNNVNSGGTILRPNDSLMNHEGMTEDKVHKNTMCRDGHCPDVNKKVETGNGISNDAETKTGDTTQ